MSNHTLKPCPLCGAPAEKPKWHVWCSSINCVLADAGLTESHWDAFHDALAAPKDEIRQLRAIISKAHTAIGNGSGCSESASLEYMQGLPDEIAGEVSRLNQTLEKAELWTNNIHNACMDLRPKQAMGEMVAGLLSFLQSATASRTGATEQKP